MKNILITGGTDGIGKGIAMNYLENGHRVIFIGSSLAKGEQIYQEAEQMNAADRAIFIQADLSLVKENKRIIEEVKDTVQVLDKVIFCATSHKSQNDLLDTAEGYEFNFALSYLSRYILSYGLMDLLENSEEPVILNVCAPGMKGEVNLEDIQNKQKSKGLKTMYHNSRLNDLLGVSFEQKNKSGHIKYILFNPWAVQTQGSFEAYQNSLTKNMMKFIYKVIASYN
ncbi:SDR family NAD(P)-dependent oxidoreductase [Niallia sp.]|uniref:SDR family NAD(P)-dependent oxidoreductase n=1 Tax=Niallia sp. TaxID=2837523 RepID=UPI00289B4AA2|nr:SDR family NAD(P)-dependent oxidoreductase [Niallia sp.]